MKCETKHSHDRLEVNHDHGLKWATQRPEDGQIKGVPPYTGSVIPTQSKRTTLTYPSDMVRLIFSF